MKALLTTKGRLSRSTFLSFFVFLNALLFVDFLSKSESVPEVTDPLGLLIWFPVLIVGSSCRSSGGTILISQAGGS